MSSGQNQGQAQLAWWQYPSNGTASQQNQWMYGASELRQSVYSFGADISKAIGNYANEMAKVDAIQRKTENHRAMAKMHLKNAGRAQEIGRQAREARMIQLGQTKGRIIASAAGSGIEVNSSDVVKKTIRDTINSAYNDTKVMARNEKEQAQGAINSMLTEQKEAIYSKALGQIMRNNANAALINGTLSAVAKGFSGASGGIGLMSGATGGWGGGGSGGGSGGGGS